VNSRGELGVAAEGVSELDLAWGFALMKIKAGSEGPTFRG